MRYEVKLTEDKILEILQRLESKIDDNSKDIKEIKNKVDAVYDQTAKTCEDVTSLNLKLDDLKEDIEFLTHKENQTEKEVYSIKKKLQIIK